MMLTTRLIAFIAVFFVCYLLLRKTRVVKLRWWLPCLIVIVALLIALSWIYPPENAFMTFSAPEETMEYRNSGKEHTYLLKIQGQESALLLYQGENDASFGVETPRRIEGGWKLPSGLGDSFLIGHIELGEKQISVTGICCAGDCYLEIRELSGNPLEVSDKYHSTFYEVNDSYIGYIGALEDYTLIIDGNSYTAECDGKVIVWTRAA